MKRIFFILLTVLAVSFGALGFFSVQEVAAADGVVYLPMDVTRKPIGKNEIDKRNESIGYISGVDNIKVVQRPNEKKRGIFSGVTRVGRKIKVGQLVKNKGETANYEAKYTIYTRLHKHKSKDGKYTETVNSLKDLTKEKLKDTVYFQKEFVNKTDNFIEYTVEKGYEHIAFLILGNNDYEKHVGTSSNGLSIEGTPILANGKWVLPASGQGRKATTISYGNDDWIIEIDVEDGKAGSGIVGSSSSSSGGGMSGATKAGLGIAIAGFGGWGIYQLLKSMLEEEAAAAGEGPRDWGGPNGLPPVPTDSHYHLDGDSGTLLYTDPAGWQYSYHVNENGEWENDDTGGILDLDRVDEFLNSRLETEAWAAGQRGNETGTTRELREIDRRYEQEEAQITLDTTREKIALRSGNFGLSRDEMGTRFENLQNSEKEQFEHYQTRANQFDNATKAAECVETAADVAMDGLGAVGGPARALNEGYKVAKGTLKGGAEAYANSKDSKKSFTEKLGNIAGGMVRGGFNGTVDAIQYHTGGSSVKTQFMTNIGGDALKGGLNAAYNGESVVKGMAKGAVNGALKVGVNQVGSAVSKKVGVSDLNQYRGKFNTIRNNWSKNLSEKSTNHLTQMAASKYGQKVTIHTIETGVGKSTTKKVIGWGVDKL